MNILSHPGTLEMNFFPPEINILKDTTIFVLFGRTVMAITANNKNITVGKVRD